MIKPPFLGYKESGFSQAIIAAGITHQVANACRRNKLPKFRCENAENRQSFDKFTRTQFDSMQVKYLLFLINMSLAVIKAINILYLLTLLTTMSILPPVYRKSYMKYRPWPIVYGLGDGNVILDILQLSGQRLRVVPKMTVLPLVPVNPCPMFRHLQLLTYRPRFDACTASGINQQFCAPGYFLPHKTLHAVNLNQFI